MVGGERATPQASPVVVRLELDALLVKVDEELVGIVVDARIPDFDKLGRNLDENLRVLVGILVVASPKVLFVQGFKAASRLIDDEPLVQRDALDLYAAPAERDVRVFKKLLGLAEILVGLEIDLVVVEKTADVAHHDVRADGAGKRHDLAVAELFKHQATAWSKVRFCSLLNCMGLAPLLLILKTCTERKCFSISAVLNPALRNAAPILTDLMSRCSFPDSRQLEIIDYPFIALR